MSYFRMTNELHASLIYVHRLRKVKCVSADGRIECNNCTKRNLRCSLARSVHLHRNIAASAQSHISSFSPPAATSESGPEKIPSLVLPLLGANLGLDVGTGTPGELLRETELTQALLLLYFTNFDDIHVMLDQTSFMRQYTLGNVPKMLLFAMMALGIRSAKSSFFHSGMLYSTGIDIEVLWQLFARTLSKPPLEITLGRASF